MPDAQQIIDLETRFWDTMAASDAGAATALMADEAIVTGPQGGSKISRGDFSRMMEGASWTLDEYRLDDVEVLFPTDDLAVIGYTVRQKGAMKDKPYDMTCADTSTWARSGGEWRCVAHTETPLGDPWGAKA
jgi:ketosteroid isomerase-like protein